MTVPQYKNGRPAKNGDKVVVIPANAPPLAGYIYGVESSSPRVVVTAPHDTVNLADCLHADDIMAQIPPLK